MNGRTHLQRGVSLIEALVAFAILAFGMLGVVGMQGTMRTNADLARQRAEAVRLGQDAVEEWRGFSTRPTTTDRMAYQDIAGSATRPVVGTNATYAVARRALTEPVTAQTVTPDRRGILVEVTWQDRSGQQQLVRLSSAVSGVEPELGASLVLATSADPLLPPMGRHRAIPRSAVPMGIGRSGFVPPGQTGGTRVAWVFDNATAALSICTTTGAASSNLNDLGVTNDCSSGTRGVLISGFVRFATTSTQPIDSTFANPIGPDFPIFGITVHRTTPSPTIDIGCFQDAMSGDYAVPYYCAVPVTTTVRVWSGTVLIGTPLPIDYWSTGNASWYKICRYQSNLSYTNQATALTNQNFAIIKAGNGTTNFSCPSGGTPPVWRHQPWL